MIFIYTLPGSRQFQFQLITVIRLRQCQSLPGCRAHDPGGAVTFNLVAFYCKTNILWAKKKRKKLIETCGKGAHACKHSQEPVCPQLPLCSTRSPQTILQTFESLVPACLWQIWFNVALKRLCLPGTETTHNRCKKPRLVVVVFADC